MNKGAKALKKKLDKARVGGADKRARSKKGTGSLSERARNAAKASPEKRGLPARIEKSRGNVNSAKPPKEIRLGGQGGTGRAVKEGFKPVPLGERPKLLGGPIVKPKTFNAGAAAGRVLGPLGYLVGMTTPAGEGSDKPSGPLMRGGRQPGYKYLEEQTVSREGKSDMPERVIKVENYPETAKPRPRPSSEKVKAFKDKMQGRKPNAKPAAKPAAKKPERPSFRGNWVGATPSEMQKRGGARIKRPGNVMSFLRGK